MLPGWVLQVQVSAVCQRPGVGWFCAAWVRCGPLECDSLGVLWVRRLCWWWWWGWSGWMYTMRWVWFGLWCFAGFSWKIEEWDNCRPVLERNSFPGYRPGVLKGVNVVTSCWNVLFGLWGVLKWWSVVTQGLQMSSVSPVFFAVWPFDYIRASSFQNFCHCPCQPLNFCAVLLLRKESNFFSHFQDSHVLGSVSLVEVFFLRLLDF